MGVATLLLTAHTAILVVASLLLLYPVVSYAWNVAYTEELLLLAASFVFLAVAYVTGFVLELSLVSSAFDLGSAVCAFTAMWRLGTRFVDREEEVTIEETGSVDGGFRGGD